MARANRYVSFLATEIEPGALATISRFERATEQAFDRIGQFNDRGTARLGLGTNFDSRTRTAITATGNALNTTRAQAAAASPAIRRVAADTNAAATAFFRSAQALNVVQGPLGPLAGRLSSLGYIFRDLAGISLAGVLGGGGAFAIGSIASQYQKVTDRLRPLYETQREANDAMREVIGIARDTRQALDPIAQLYGRIGAAAKDAGIQVDASRLTTTVARAARLSGGDNDTQQAGIGQFLQGFGSGTLAGDELKSIRENTFRLAKAIADGLGVPIAKLKELGSEGKLTPQIVAEALARSADQIDAEFARLPLRVGQALQLAGNNLGIFIGRLDEASGATTGFAKGINFIGENIQGTIVAVSGLAAVFAARSFAAPVGAATASLERFAAAQIAISRARRGAPVTLLTPEGIERAKARSAVDAATGPAQAADARARAARAEAFAADQNLVKAKEAAAIALGQQRAAEQAQREGLVLAQARVSAAQQEIAAATEAAAIRAASDKAAALEARNRARADLAGARGNVTRLNNALATNAEGAANVAGSRADRNRAAKTFARERIAIEAELAAAQDRVSAATARLEAQEAALATTRAAARTQTLGQVTATQALATAEAELAAATGAATVSTNANTTAANANAARGIGVLRLAEQRIAAERAAVVAMEGSAAAQNVLTAALARSEIAQRAFATATALSTRAKQAFTKAGAALSAMLGGPVGIALTAATIGFTYLATRTDEAKEAADRYRTAQDDLAAKLNTTTAALANQSAAARQLRIDLAEAGVEQARQTRQAVADSLANKLTFAAARIGVRGGVGDAGTLSQAASNLRAGRDSGLRYEDLSAILRRNPGALPGGGASSLASFLGINPRDIAGTVGGFAQTGVELRERIADAQRARSDAAKPPPPPINFNGPTRRSSEQLVADAGDLATGGTKLLQARKDYAKQKADLDAELKKRRDSGDFSFDDEYVRQLAAAQSKLNAVGDAERNATKARSAGARATREATAATNDRLRREDALAAILNRNSEEPSAVRRIAQVTADIDKLYRKVEKGGKEIEIPTINVDGESVTKAEAIARATASINRPYNDFVQQQKEGLAIGDLRLRGLGAEADILELQLGIEKSLGIQREKGESLDADRVKTIREYYVRNQQLNRLLERRNRLVERQAESIGAVRDSLRDALAGGSLKSVFSNLAQTFRQQLAEQLTFDLIGDPEQDFRDRMTEALNGSADNLTTSADRLDEAAAAIKDAAGVFAGGASGAATDSGGDIVVTGRRVGAKRDDAELRMSTEQRYNKVGREVATKLFGQNSVFTKVAGRLGTTLKNASLYSAGGKPGTAIGALSGLLGNGALGTRGIGGAISRGADALGRFAPMYAAAQAIGDLTAPLIKATGLKYSKTGQRVGGVLGGIIGGFFKKTPYATSSIGSVDSVLSATGNGSTNRKAATGLGGSVQSGIAGIIEQLGGTEGAFNVSIGTYKGKYRVSTTGYNGRLGNQGSKTSALGIVDFGDDEAAAIQFAIRNAIEDGAVKGIRDGAKRLLAAGADLDRQLQKAVDFQGVFRELKQYTDPVGAAIDDLNTQFDRLIDIFNEAGASSGEFADLQKLYDLKRADAIKAATDGALDNIQSFIDGLKAGPDSPLGRRTVYDNAKTNVDAFRADLAAGKVVDNDKLLAALSDYQSASRTLNGSRGAFFQDFDEILRLAEQAKANITSSQTGNGALPASPFDDPAVKKNLQSTADSTTAMQTTLEQILAQMKSSGSGAIYGGTAIYSSMDYLPSRLLNQQ